MSEVLEKPKTAKALKKYKITFHGKGGDVEIVHNFKLNVYKRNVETTIDEHFLGVLKDAVIKTRVQDENGVWANVSIPTFSYTIDGEV